MKLTERLRYQAAKPDCPKHVEALLEEAATRIEDQRQWRAAWLKAERRIELLTLSITLLFKRVELLTSELSMLRLARLNRKKKECND